MLKTKERHLYLFIFLNIFFTRNLENVRFSTIQKKILIPILTFLIPFAVPEMPSRSAQSPFSSSPLQFSFSSRTERAAQILRELFTLLLNKGETIGLQARGLARTGVLLS